VTDVLSVSVVPMGLLVASRTVGLGATASIIPTT
jgi:hypothetical protein